MMQFVDVITAPQFLAMVLAGISVFITVLTLIVPLMSADRSRQRMMVMATEREKMRAIRLSQLTDGEKTGSLRRTPKGYMQHVVDQLKLQDRFNSEEVREKLRMAGLRGQAPLTTYMFFRVAMPVILFFATLLYVFFLADLGYPAVVKFIICIGIAFLGFFAPDLFLQNMIQKRQKSIKNAFPDALDMLLICVQSGMSLEAALSSVSKEIIANSLELAEELSLTTAELSYLPERRQAFENLGKRTGLAGVKAVGTALIQAERYGTPVSQALRVMAKENRDIRMSEAEQKAAALPPKLTVPMIIFFLPVLFVVILGPAAIKIWVIG